MDSDSENLCWPVMWDIKSNSSLDKEEAFFFHGLASMIGVT